MSREPHKLNYHRFDSDSRNQLMPSRSKRAYVRKSTNLRLLGRSWQSLWVA